MFKSTLDEPNNYLKYDQLRVYDSILGLKGQIHQAWLETLSLSLKNKYTDLQNLVISGMGGSSLGGRIIRSLDQYILNLPLEVVTNYRLPAYVNKNTLVVLVSYSGNTEETLSTALDAKARGAKVFVIATGGKLLDFAKDNGYDAYRIDPKFNPSNQPRMGLGYSVVALIALLSRLKFVNFTEDDLNETISLLERLTPTFGKDNPQITNPAKGLAEKLLDRGLVIISSNHLVGVAHAMKNMFNENSKTFSALFDLPELNHHFLEGLPFPKNLKDSLSFVFLNSDLYPNVIKKRLQITRAMIERVGFPVITIKPESSHPTQQAFECLYFGEFLSFYLAILNRLDPGPIPSVDYFKKELTRI